MAPEQSRQNLVETRKGCDGLGLVSLAIFIPLGALVLLILILAGVSAGKRNGGDDLIRNVYMYVVLFATLMMTIGGSVGVVMNFADMVAPAAHWQTFDEYVRMREDPSQQNGDSNEISLDREELRKSYDDIVIAYREMQINRAKNNMIKSFAWIIVPLPVFLAFRRMIDRHTAQT